jgi:hypothetical protein
MWQNLQFAFALTTCPHAPLLSWFLTSLTTPIGLLHSDPQKFLAALWANLLAAPAGIVDKMAFAATYQAGWLAPSPGVMVQPLARWVNQGIGYVITGTLWAAAVLPPAVFLVQLLRRRTDGAIWCGLALWAGVFGHVAIYRAWSFYTGGLVIPLAALIVVIGLSSIDALQTARISTKAVTVALSPLYLLFLASTWLLLINVMPPTIRAAHPSGIGMPDQTISIPALAYSRQKTEIREFARRCHLQADGARRLVVDNLTVFAFDNLREPLQSDYLYDDGFGVDYKGDALPALLRRLGAKGMITQCTMLSASLAPKVTRDGNLCCINFDETH